MFGLNIDEETDYKPTGLELKMQLLWSDLLKVNVSKIHASSNFFQIGGDSILAMRLVQAGKKQGISFTLNDIFHQTQLVKLVSVTKCSSIESLIEFEESESISRFSLLQSRVIKDKMLAFAALECAVELNNILDIYPSTPFQEGLLSLTLKDPKAYVPHAVFSIAAEAI